jgi:hypothetical protein
MVKKDNPISEWSEEIVNKVYAYHLDDMHPLDRVSARKIHITIEHKRAYLIEVERKFTESFK